MSGTVKRLLGLGLVLVALWLVLSVTRAVVGAALWALLIAGIVLLGAAVVRHVAARTPFGP